MFEKLLEIIWDFHYDNFAKFVDFLQGKEFIKKNKYIKKVLDFILFVGILSYSILFFMFCLIVFSYIYSLLLYAIKNVTYISIPIIVLLIIYIIYRIFLEYDDFLILTKNDDDKN
jgi:hypothetical protein